jgi:hypothetical protein
MIKRLFFSFILSLVFWACAEDEESLAEDCAGVAGGNNICGCTDITAFNYNSNATFDDGSCQSHIDNGDFYLFFNGSNAHVDLGDMLSQGAYTKAAWVKRIYGYAVANNIISGNTGHAFWAPQNQGSKLSAGHNGDYTVVQDTDSLPTGVWNFVAVTYDPDAASGTMTLYRNGVPVDQATGVAPQDESTTTYIGKFNNGNYWLGSIDEVGIWNEALTATEILELSNSSIDLGASANHGDYTSSDDLQGYWKMNEGEGGTLSDASGNGHVGTINMAVWNTCDECGCTDPTACNYDPAATLDNRTCLYDDDPCDTCVNGEILVNDNDLDGICDDADDDDDNDGVTDENDADPFDNTLCSDTDQDGCDDCSSGIYDLSNDGPDDDGDGICNAYIISGGTVYIVGESYNSEGMLTACYWVDGSRVELPGGDWATDIFVSNGTVYTSGTSGANACYWINDTRYDLPGDGGEGEAIAVHDNDVYVAGWYNDGSCYWKNGERIDLTTNAESQAFAVGIRSNGDVYVGGYYMNNHHYYIPCFWKNGNRTNLPIPSGGDGEVYDIAFMDGNMRYYAGYTLRPDNFAGLVPKACYWRHTTRTDLPLGGSSMDIYGATGWGITIDGEDVYVAGYTDWYEFWGQEETTGGSFPQYWKNSTIHDLEGGPLTNFGTGVAYDIRVADGNVVAVGAATRDSSYYDSYLSACYWLNGERHYLVKQSQVPEGLEDWYWSKAMGVFIE